MSRAVAFEPGQQHSVAVSRNLGKRLDEDVDLPAAGQADLPRLVVGDPVGKKPRLAGREHLLSLDGDVALDAAAGDRAEELALFGDDQLRGDRPRGGAAGRDHRRKRNPVAASEPAPGLLKDVVHTLSVPPAGGSPARRRGLR